MKLSIILKHNPLWYIWPLLAGLDINLLEGEDGAYSIV